VGPLSDTSVNTQTELNNSPGVFWFKQFRFHSLMFAVNHPTRMAISLLISEIGHSRATCSLLFSY
jgi:hypothetical protein